MCSKSKLKLRFNQWIHMPLSGDAGGRHMIYQGLLILPHPIPQTSDESRQLLRHDGGFRFADVPGCAAAVVRVEEVMDAAVRLRKLDAMPVLPPLPPMQATPRVGSSSSCPSIHLKPGDRPPTRARGSAVSVCPVAARFGVNQTGGWSE